jgi:hypothetical protein
MLDYCATGPKPCRKNLGIPRIHMPQINSALDFKLLKGIVRKLGLKSKIKDLNVKKPEIRNHIYASQKEINTDIANHIASSQHVKTPAKNPVIMLHCVEEKEYLVVDGHHRWLAHHLHPSTMKPKMKCYLIQTKPNEKLENTFHTLNDTLRKDPHLFHKRHSFTQKKRQNKRNTRKKK